jgi:hypothetical protein
MLHSTKIMQSMLARRPSEEDADTKPVAQSAPQSQQEAAPVQPRPLERYQDPAEPILRAHGVDESVAAEVWDLFHSVRDSKQLADKLQSVDIPNATKHELVVEKQKDDPAPGWLDRLDRTVEAIKRVAKLHSIPARDGKSVAEFAERHPNVMKALVDAELKDKETRQ